MQMLIHPRLIGRYGGKWLVCAEMPGFLVEEIPQHGVIGAALGSFSYIFGYGRGPEIPWISVVLRMITEKDKEWLGLAIALAKEGIEKGVGGPFGCVIVKDGVAIGKGS